MDPITQQIVLGAAGAAGGDKVYVDDVFSTYVYEGQTTAQPIPNGIDLDGEGGLIWIKGRDGRSHSLTDTVTGIDKNLISNNQNQQATDADRITHKTANGGNGFTLYGDGTNVNYAGEKFVSWTFRKAPGFFDVVTYNGDTSNNPQSIPHSLGSVPGFIIVKRTDNTGPWICYHRSLGNTKNIELQSPNDDDINATIWNNTDPTSTHFTVGSNANVNGNGRTFVAYIFAHDDAQFGTDGDESIIKCGTYEGLTYPNYRQIDLGFEPQLVLIKNADASSNWTIRDIMRVGQVLRPNGTDSEVDENEVLRITSTGFEVRGGSTDFGANSNTYIYIAIRRPNKPPETGADVFAIDTKTGSIPNFISGFPVDFVIQRDGINSGNDVKLASRLQGRKFLKSNSTEAESNAFVAAAFDHQNGFASGTGSSPDSENFAWMFKRAPGFMDVVAYTANNNTAFNVNHNLGVAPELVIIKNRDTAYNWLVGSDALTAWGNYALRLNTSGGENTSSNFFTAAPTSTQFKLGTSSNGNYGTDKFIAYLFATLPGISKVGSYSGNTSNAIDVNCGFIAGARFILIKRTDTGSTGDWYVWDTTRGINPVGTNSGLDPYLLLNRDNNGTDAQVTNTDYIDPLTTGFTVSASAPAALNATGGTYLYLAIA